MKTIRLEGGTPIPPRLKRRFTYFIAALTKSGKIKAVKIGSATNLDKRIRDLQTSSFSNCRCF